MMQLLLVSLATASIAVGSWIHVPSGQWEPSAQEVVEAKKRIHEYMIAEASRQNRKLKEWSSYTFQYQGGFLNGNTKSRHYLDYKIIFINAFCSKPYDGVTEHLVQVMDGGTCYFRAYYDPVKKEFIAARFNGLA